MRTAYQSQSLEIFHFFVMNFFSFVRRFFFCWLTIIFLNVHAEVRAGQAMMPIRVHALEIKPSLSRILELNIENAGEFTRSAAILESLERTLSALQPTLIMGFSHLADDAPLSTAQMALFLEIKQKTVAANPRCKFAVALHVSHYLTVSELLAKLQEVTTKLGPDMINMVVSSSNDVISPTALAKGINFAHAHGQLVTYEGPANMIPDGVDGFVMKAVNGEVHRDEVNSFKIKHHLPVIVRFSSGACSQEQKEIMLLSRLAEEQAPFGYHLAYPLQLASSANLNENKDGASLVMLRALLTKYN